MPWPHRHELKLRDLARATRTAARSRTIPSRCPRARSCSTRSTACRAPRPVTWRSGGTARPASAARAAPRSTAGPRLMCMMPALGLRAGRDDHRHADADVPGDPRPGHRRVVQLREGQASCRPPSWVRATPTASGGWRRSTSSAGQEFRKCIECFLCQNVCHVVRDHEDNKEAFAGPRFFLRYAELDMHPLDTHDRRELAQGAAGLGMCNITKCCTEVCPEGIKITDNAIIPMKERVVDQQVRPAGVARQQDRDAQQGQRGPHGGLRGRGEVPRRLRRRRAGPVGLAAALPARVELARRDAGQPPGRGRPAGPRRPGRPPACGAPDDHDPPLRVSGIQSGSWSGPVGSTRGQQRFREGQTVTRGAAALRGLAAGVRARRDPRAMDISHRSMAALWMAGFEDDPEQEQCGELCVVEVFGNALGRRLGGGRGRHQGVPRPRPHPGLRRAPGRRRRGGRSTPMPSTGTPERGDLQRRRRRGTPLPPAADVPAAADGGGLRLPGVVHRRRRPPGAPAGRRPHRRGLTAASGHGAVGAAVLPQAPGR